MLHSRDAFEDSPQNTRHLVRLFLKNEKMAWKLPAHLGRGNDKMFYDEILEERWEIFPHERMSWIRGRNSVHERGLQQQKLSHWSPSRLCFC